MRTVIIALLLIGLVAATAVVSSRMRQSRSNAKDRDVMRLLRQRALQTPPDQMVPGATDDEPFAVLMDMGFPGATATLFAASTGDASLYVSSGGGVIGGIGHENVRTAAIHLVTIAADWRGEMKPTTDFSYPKRDASVSMSAHGPPSTWPNGRSRRWRISRTVSGRSTTPARTC